MKKLIAVILGTALSLNAFAAKPDCKVNLNTATAKELVKCLDRVGEKVANSIVEWRDKKRAENKDFLITDVNQLVGEVSRFGEKTAEMNIAKVCFTEKDCKGEGEAQPASKGTEPAPKVDDAPGDDFPDDGR